MKYNFDELVKRENTNSVKYDLKQEIFGNKDVLPMWVADMDFKTPDFIVEKVCERANHPIYGYTFRPESFYQSAIDWLKRRQRWEIKKEWLLVTPGVVPAVHLAVLAFTEPGDKIVVQPPVYFPFFGAVKSTGRKLVYNPLLLKENKYKFDFEDLKSKLDSDVKMLILSSPHNPGGRVWTKEELQELAEICLENQILILSDEIHGDLVFQPSSFIPMASISREIAEKTITLTAPSKTFNLAGLATSLCIISSPDLRDRFNETIEKLHIGMGNMFGTTALEAAYTHGYEWLDQALLYIKKNIDFVCEFSKIHLPEIQVMKPEGTYLIWLDFRKLKLSEDALKKFIIEKAKLGLNDGNSFGPGGEGFMRMNVACPLSIVKKAMNQLKTALKELC